MKLRLPVVTRNGKESRSAAVSVEGKQYNVDKEGCVEIPNSIPKATVAHLVSGLGWAPADPAASKVFQEATGKQIGETSVEEAVADEAAKNPDSAKKVAEINKNKR